MSSASHLGISCICGALFQATPHYIFPISAKYLTGLALWTNHSCFQRCQFRDRSSRRLDGREKFLSGSQTGPDGYLRLRGLIGGQASSYPWYVGNPRKRPVWLEVEKVLGESAWKIGPRIGAITPRARNAKRSRQPGLGRRRKRNTGNFGAGGVLAARSFGSGFWGCSIRPRTGGKRGGLAMRFCGGSTGRRKRSASWHGHWRR
jgi:hypothetical protein